jgi:hypothetical protein
METERGDDCNSCVLMSKAAGEMLACVLAPLAKPVTAAMREVVLSFMKRISVVEPLRSQSPLWNMIEIRPGGRQTS